jgi:alkylation response protein AidB-like acyl-CoA dehydrogenase
VASALSPEVVLFRDTTRQFLEQQSPVGSLRALEGDDTAFDRQWWRQGAELGWASLLVPEDLGGGSLSGSGIEDLALVAQELGRVAAPGALVPVSVVAALIARTAPQGHADLLEALVSGDAVAAWAVWEDPANSGPAAVALSARRSAGGWTLSGKKILVEAAQVAGTFLVVARADEGLTQFVVPADAAGVSIEPTASLDLGRRFPTVTFENVAVAEDALVGVVGGAAADVAYGMSLGALLQSAESYGVMERVLEFTLDYMANRYTFGRSLSSYQALKHRVAELKVSLEASGAVTMAAARALSGQSPDAAQRVSAAKAYVGEKSTELIQECVQLHGGIGVTWEHDLHLYLRRATVNRFTYGTPEEHRERLAASAGI